METYRYQPDGIVDTELDDSSKPTVLKESYSGVDVSINWEPVPAFGE
jgi:hypothetical protein